MPTRCTTSRRHRLDATITPSIFFVFGLLLLASLLSGSTCAAQAQKASPSLISAKTNGKSQPRLGMRFAVQVGAFDSRSGANRLALKTSLITRLPVLISPVKVEGKELFRVRVLTKRRGDAEALAARLRQEGNLRTWVVDLSEP